MKNEYVKIAGWMTSPFLLGSIYALMMYGNAKGSIGMGGLEVALFYIYIGLPMFILGLITFIMSIVTLWKQGHTVKKEVITFVVSLIAFTLITFGVMALSSYCSGPASCSFIPETNYIY